MKKIIILQLILLLVISFTYAQDKPEKIRQKKNLPTPLIEVWGGMGLSTVAGSVAATDKRLTGLFGAGFTMPLSMQNNLHFEAAYTFSGFKYKPGYYQPADTMLYLDKAEQRLNYFKITVQDRYFIDKNRRFYANGGIYIAFLLHSRFQANYQTGVIGTESEVHHEVDEANKDDFKSVDFGLTGGVGVRLGNKEVSCFTIELRAAYGLINMVQPKDDQTFNEKNLYGIIKLGIDIPTKN